MWNFFIHIPDSLLKYKKNKSVYDGSDNAVDDDRTGYYKHFCSESADIAFTSEFHSRRYNGIGKARDGYKCACTGKFGDIIIPAQSSE